MLAVLGGEDGVRRMELMRRCDVDDLDGRIGAQRTDVVIDGRVEIPRERRARRRMLATRSESSRGSNGLMR